MPIQTVSQALDNEGRGSPYGFKNRIINGAMMIDQRNAGAAVTNALGGNGTYTLDRWAMFGSAASKFTVQQNAGSVTPPVGFTNYLGVTSLSAYSVPVGEIYEVLHRIEGLNTSDLAWGTANAATVTLSFWVRSSLTGTFGGAFNNSAQNRSYPFTYTISSANTWEQKSVVISGDTTGTWLTTNGTGLQIVFGLGVGSTYSAASGAWTAGTYVSATGATSVVGTSGATWYITGVQLEKGNQATSFDYRPFTTELALCQRYYERRQTGGAYYGVGLSGTWATTTLATTAVNFAVPKRTSSSVNGSNLSVRNGGSIIAITSYSGTYSSGTGQYGYIAGALDVVVASGGTAGYGATITDNSTGTGYIEFSSEL